MLYRILTSLGIKYGAMQNTDNCDKDSPTAGSQGRIAVQQDILSRITLHSPQ